MNRHRLLEIDYLRGIAIVAMMVIHTAVFFLSESNIVFSLWNYSQFAVPLFIFCSAYVFFEREKGSESFLPYLRKRLIRLVKPYYLFMIPFFIAVAIREPQKLSLRYITKSVFLIGGIDINWLVFLFVCLTFIMPFVRYSFQKKRSLFWIFLCCSVFSSVLFSLWKVPFDYRFVMWLPWSVIVLFSFFFVRFARKRFFPFLIIFISVTIFFVFQAVESLRHVSLNLYDNKYPPNIFFLSYGVFWIIILFFVAQKHLFSFFPVKHLFLFLSRYSYSLFFIHYFFLYLLSTTVQIIHVHFITFFLSVVCASVGATYLHIKLLRSIS